MNLTRLGALLGSIVTGVLAFITGYFGRKIAVTTVIAAAFLTALAALWLAISALVAGLIASVPTNGLFYWLLVGFNLVLPSNWVVCVSAMLTADAAVFLYRWNNAHVIGVASST